ncbi:hypothetical protein HDV01_006425 [Terramyces sp. JEL0728]|nr:hypothetical protein HDV01_006425 [Terramyces sp. JEL0728]
MTVFPDTNVSYLWSVWDGDYQYPYCGCDYVPLNTGCCISSIDLDYSDGFQSSTYVVAPDDIPFEDYWQGANNGQFCKYSAASGEQIDWGYISRHIKPNGICYDGIACTESQMNVYNTQNCTGEFQTLELTDTVQEFQLSNFSASAILAAYTTFNGGESVKQWTAYFPAAGLVPNFQTPVEILGLISYILALALSLYANYREISKFFQKGKVIYVLLLGQLLWTFWVVIKIMDWTFVYESDLDYEIVEEILYVVYNISTMLAISATFSMMLNFYEIKDHKQRIYRYVLLLALHVILAGGGYFVILSYNPDLALVFSYWYVLFPFWTILLYLVNTIPPIAVLFKLGYIFGYSRQISSPIVIVRRLVKKAPIMAILVPCQALNTICYGILISIMLYTHILKNDRNSLAWNGLISFCMIVHEVLNYWIKSNIGKLVKLMDKDESSAGDVKPSNSATKYEDSSLVKSSEYKSNTSYEKKRANKNHI